MLDAQESKPHSLVALAALAAALAVAGSAYAQQSATVCRPRSIGPGALVHGGRAGALCFLHAYRQGCAAARYELSSFGVDTIGTLQFALARRNGSCSIDVSRTFRVVPQPAHVTARGRCSRLGMTATDIVATRCTGTGLTSTVSLTH